MSECGGCARWFAGSCFRYPPQMVLHPSDNQHPVIYYPVPMRPFVQASEMACGEYAPSKISKLPPPPEDKP